MASIRKINGKWQAQVARKGIRKSKLFQTKRDALDWAAHQEHSILNGSGEYGPGTLGDLFHRYAKEVSPTKKGARWEQIRLSKLGQDKIALVQISHLRAGDFADWRDRRLIEVSPSSVAREMTLIRSVLSIARREWGLLPNNPMADVKKPREPQGRDRRVSSDELASLYAAASGSRLCVRAIQAFEFAIETAMRAGEICALEADSITGRVARLEDTKNGTRREVPLSKRALEIWGDIGGNGFGLKPAQLDTAFRRTRDAVGIENMHFHDSRHEAVTRLAKKLPVLDLSRMTGHKDLKMLMRYYNESAENMAHLLD